MGEQNDVNGMSGSEVDELRAELGDANARIARLEATVARLSALHP